MQSEFIKRGKKSINLFLFWGVFAGIILIACVVLQVTGQFRNFHAEILRRQANEAYQQEDFNKRIEILSKLVSLKPDDAIAQYDLGVAYIDVNKKDKAMKQVAILRKLNREDLFAPLETLIIQSKYRIIREADPMKGAAP